MTTRMLVLIRHAKAEQDGATDADRVLSARGLADATALGQWLAEHDLHPDRVVVSPARRTQQTWSQVAESVQGPPPRLDERLYDNTVAALLDVVHDTPDSVDTLVLVGHNPSTHALTLVLDDGEGDSDARAAVHSGFPTSGVAVFAVTAGWPDVDEGAGTLGLFAAPRA